MAVFVFSLFGLQWLPLHPSYIGTSGLARLVGFCVYNKLYESEPGTWITDKYLSRKYQVFLARCQIGHSRLSRTFISKPRMCVSVICLAVDNHWISHLLWGYGAIVLSSFWGVPISLSPPPPLSLSMQKQYISIIIYQLYMEYSQYLSNNYKCVMTTFSMAAMKRFDFRKFNVTQIIKDVHIS